MSVSPSPQRRDWQDVAVDYAQSHGWTIVPIHPGAGTPSGQDQNPVFTQLGHQPLVEVPDGASSRPGDIRDWTGMPRAIIGVLTGRESGLVALEVPDGNESALTADEERDLQALLPETRTVIGRDRTYYLFTYPGDAAGLSGLNRSDGLVLHGDESVVPLPGPPSNRRRAYWWSLNDGDEMASLPSSVRSLFGVEKPLASVLSTEERGQNVRRTTESKPEWRGARPETDVQGAKGGASPRISFRSGHELKSDDRPSSDINVPWLSNGALSVLAGAPKTAGKSTFVTNLAVHLAAGRMFLERSLQPTSVVLLSDLPPSQFRRLITKIGVGRDALSRLHVMHPRDAGHHDWRALLRHVFDHAVRTGAGLIVLDSIDQFIEAKRGLGAVASEDVATMLTTEAPSECATLAVKSVSCGPGVPMSETIEQLRLVGSVSHLVARMDALPSGMHRTLRRLQFRGRLGEAPSYLLCEMIRGRYQRVHADRVRGSRSFGDHTETQTETRWIDGREDGEQGNDGESLRSGQIGRQGQLGLLSGAGRDPSPPND